MKSRSRQTTSCASACPARRQASRPPSGSALTTRSSPPPAQRLGSQQVDIARFLDQMHNELTQLEDDRKAAREQQYALNQERAKLAREGDVELRNRTREFETKLASLLKDFEFQMRETVRAIEDRAAQQKLSKEAERRIQRLRREFQESFNQTVVAHRTGADQGDANAQPHVVKHVAAGDQVRLKSMNKVAVVQREIEKDVFEVALGPIKMRVKRDDIAEVLRPAEVRVKSAQIRSPPPAARRTCTSPSPAPTPTTCAWRSTSSAAPWMKPPKSWKSI